MSYKWQYFGYVVNKVLKSPPIRYTDSITCNPYNSNNLFFIYTAKNTK